MAKMASWGPMVFEVSQNKVAILEDLTTSLTLKQDSENDTSGTQPTNTRGRELRPITFKVTYLSAAGVNPRKMIQAWEDQLGNSYPLIVGGERFGAAKMTLKKVSTSKLLLSNAGGFLKAEVSITLEEYSTGSTSKLKTTATATAAAATYQATVAAKKEALNATASASDRATRKGGGH